MEDLKSMNYLECCIKVCTLRDYLLTLKAITVNIESVSGLDELGHKKTCFLHMQKQRHRSAVW